MQSFSCECGNPLFFENTVCLKCRFEVGFDPASMTMRPLTAEAPVKRCSNGVKFAVCNWLLPKEGAGDFCLSCSLNQMIPNLGSPQIVGLWAKMEGAKHRAAFSLLSLGLPLQPLPDPGNLGAESETGAMVPLKLSYRLLQPFPNAPVITGHDAGLITLNLEEADDSIRERNRANLAEPYRTLLGHFRHEIGHYYWSMWFENDAKRDEVLPAYRALYGDERASYCDAMQAYYQNGPRPGWQENCISAYSTMHPWEDWAETWAHYLHLMDALESFESLGLRRSPALPKEIVDKIDHLPAPFDKISPVEFTRKLQTWLELTPAINEISSSLGHNMSYPFVISTPVIRKLFFIDCLVKRQAAALVAAGEAAVMGNRTPRVNVNVAPAGNGGPPQNNGAPVGNAVPQNNGAPMNNTVPQNNGMQQNNGIPQNNMAPVNNAPPVANTALAGTVAAAGNQGA